MEIIALEQELEQLYLVIEHSEVEPEIDDAYKRISEVTPRLRDLRIAEAKELGLEYVEPLTPEEADLLHEWHPNFPRPELTCSIRKELILRYPSFDGKADVIVEFKATRFFCLGRPGFDGRCNHELTKRGLDQLLAGRIMNSKRVAEMDALEPFKTRRVSNHYIFCFHDDTFECIAGSFEVSVVAKALEPANAAKQGTAA